MQPSQASNRNAGRRWAARGAAALAVLVLVWWLWGRAEPVPTDVSTSALPRAGIEDDGGVSLSAGSSPIEGPSAGSDMQQAPGAMETEPEGEASASGAAPAGESVADIVMGSGSAAGGLGSELQAQVEASGATPGGGAGVGSGAASSRGAASGDAQQASHASEAQSSDPNAVPSPEPTLVVHVRDAVEFREGGDAWSAIYAKATLAGQFNSGFPAVPFPQGLIVEPLDTRTPDERERHLPKGRPRLICTELDWNADEIELIRIDAAFVRDGVARIYFLRDGEVDFDENHYVEVGVTGESGVGRWSFPMREQAAWRGPIRGVRLDLVDHRVPFLIERLTAVERTVEPIVSRDDEQ